MKRALIAFLVIVLFSHGVFSQQMPMLDNYIFNPVSVSPAFTGKYYKFQAVVTHRSQWTNIPGAPIIGNINIDGSPHKNMGVGGSLLFSKAGIYTNFSLNLNYAYHLQLAKEHFLSFGINAAFYQNSLDLSDIVVRNTVDPILAGNSKLSEAYFNAGLGFLYSWKELNFCLSFPLLFNNRSFYSDNTYNHVLSMDRNFLILANYTLAINPDWQLKFDLLFRQNQYSTWTIDVSTLVKFKENYWLGIMYRKPNIFGINAGLAFINRIIFNYTFEFSGFAMNNSLSGTHEISLGFRLLRESQKNLQIRDYVR